MSEIHEAKAVFSKAMMKAIGDLVQDINDDIAIGHDITPDQLLAVLIAMTTPDLDERLMQMADEVNEVLENN